MRKFILILIFLFPSLLFSQRDITDSLKKAVNETNIDTVKIQLYNQLSNVLKGRDNEQALMFAKKSLALAKKTNYLKGVAPVYKTIGILKFFQGELDSAFVYFDKSLKTYKELGDKKGVAAGYVNIGILKKNIGEIKEAGNSYQKALEVYKEIDDNEGVAKTYLNLG
ncbi:MAG: tetratricopeptide repeat protein, partial [Chlorobi bacterium]|nr:tetratricopeptide repeat protein [Chlorobiota bacterium]